MKVLMLNGRFERGTEDHGFAADGGLVEIEFLEIVHTECAQRLDVFPSYMGAPSQNLKEEKRKLFSSNASDSRDTMKSRRKAFAFCPGRRTFPLPQPLQRRKS